MEPLSEVEVRVLACLIEKEATVPDSYPLTLNAVRQACNQTSNREPVVAFDELDVQRALDNLKISGLVRFVHPAHGERVTKFRHIVGEAMDLDRPQLAVLGVLALRGPQTAGELRTRTERYPGMGGEGVIDAALAALERRDEALAVLLPRVPGQHQVRWAHLLAGPVDPEALAAAGPARAAVGGPTADRLAALEAQVGELAARLARLEGELGLEG